MTKQKRSPLSPQKANFKQQERESKVGTKSEENILDLDTRELVFSFKYFGDQMPPGQHFKEWESNIPFSETLKKVQNLIKEYGIKFKEEDSALQELVFEEFIDKLNTLVDDFLKSSDNKNQGLLSDLFERLVELSRLTRNDAIGKKDKTNPLGIYPNFSFKEQSDFKEPTYRLPKDAQWGTLKRIGGQKARVAGFIKDNDNTFYIVFLDREHKFYKS
jgi:hypothetical protein